MNSSRREIGLRERAENADLAGKRDTVDPGGGRSPSVAASQVQVNITYIIGLYGIASVNARNWGLATGLPLDLALGSPTPRIQGSDA